MKGAVKRGEFAVFGARTAARIYPVFWQKMRFDCRFLAGLQKKQQKKPQKRLNG